MKRTVKKIVKMSGQLKKKTGSVITNFFLFTTTRDNGREQKIPGHHRKKGLIKDKKTRKVIAVMCDRCQKFTVYHPRDENGHTDWTKVIPRPY